MAALIMAGLDQWVTLDATGYEVILGGDELCDPDHRVRVETSYVGGLHFRCLQMIPAGLWIRPLGYRDLWVPPGDRYTTEEFRRTTGDRQ